MKPTEQIIKTIRTKKGRWEIYNYGKQYGTRLISRNGRLICGNTGFNTIKSAMKNIKAIQSTCQ